MLSDRSARRQSRGVPLTAALTAAPAAGPPAAFSVALVDEHVVIRAAARRAEDAGDLLGARRLLGLLAHEADVAGWLTSIEAGLRCRDDDERALWLLQPAFRHGHVSATRQTLLSLAADVLRTRGRPASAGSSETALAAATDPLLVDAGLFDLGMLERYLDRVLRPAGHPLVAVLERWVTCRTSVFEVEATDPPRLTDRVQDRLVPDLRGGEGLEAGQLLYGRLLPLPVGCRFAVAPVPVDRLTARRIVRAVLRAAPPVEQLRAVASHQRRLAAAEPPAEPA